jgi:hypothetical protein
MATGAADVFLPHIFQLIRATEKHRHLPLQALKEVSFDPQNITQPPAKFLTLTLIILLINSSLHMHPALACLNTPTVYGTPCLTR